MCVPIIVPWKSLLDTIVEVLVMGEDDMASDIVELTDLESVGLSDEVFDLERLTKPSGVTSVPARPPAFSDESIIIHEGPFCRMRQSGRKPPQAAWCSTHDLVQTLGSTEASGPHANDENIDVSATPWSVE